VWLGLFALVLETDRDRRRERGWLGSLLEDVAGIVCLHWCYRAVWESDVWLVASDRFRV
jgi:hypothetical protein